MIAHQVLKETTLTKICVDLEAVGGGWETYAPLCVGYATGARYDNTSYWHIRCHVYPAGQSRDDIEVHKNIFLVDDIEHRYCRIYST